MDQSKDQDLQKARSWRKVIREASRSGVSIREFCRRRRLKERQFYVWQRRLQEGRRMNHGQDGAGPATFALVSEEPGPLAAGLELVLPSGMRLRIGRGVDATTLRAVLAVVHPEPC